MPMYRLLRLSDNKSFDKEARDDEHAVALFGQELGVNLTLAEGLAASPYMMGVVEKEVSWAKPPNIPVFEADE